MSQKRQTPLGASPAAQSERRYGLGFYGVAALAVLALCGRDCQPHFLAQGSRKEAAQRMRLPPGGFQQFLRSHAALQQFEDGRRLATVAGTGGFLSAFGRFLGWAGLLPALPLPGATFARRAPGLAFFAAFVSVVAAVSSVNVFI
jgi:hypothetical protein